MIDEKKLIEDLKNYCGKQPYLVSENIWEIINSQPKIGSWIPCSERLPQESGYYLVTYHEWSNGEFLPKFDDTYVERLHYQKSEQFTGWNFPKCVDKRAEDDMNREVLAWQPLPEAYHG